MKLKDLNTMTIAELTAEAKKCRTAKEKARAKRYEVHKHIWWLEDEEKDGKFPKHAKDATGNFIYGYEDPPPQEVKELMDFEQFMANRVEAIMELVRKVQIECREEFSIALIERLANDDDISDLEEQPEFKRVWYGNIKTGVITEHKFKNPQFNAANTAHE